MYEQSLDFLVFDDWLLVENEDHPFNDGVYEGVLVVVAAASALEGKIIRISLKLVSLLLLENLRKEKVRLWRAEVLFPFDRVETHQTQLNYPEIPLDFLILLASRLGRGVSRLFFLIFPEEMQVQEIFQRIFLVKRVHQLREQRIFGIQTVSSATDVEIPEEKLLQSSQILVFLMVEQPVILFPQEIYEGTELFPEQTP